jgi:hypothetical protein
MTYLEYEATRLFVTAAEEDAEIDAALDEAVETVLDADIPPMQPIKVVPAPLRFHNAGPLPFDPIDEEEWETAPFDNQIKGLPDDDEIIEVLRLLDRSAQIRIDLRAELEAELAVERAKAGF